MDSLEKGTPIKVNRFAKANSTVDDTNFVKDLTDNLDKDGIIVRGGRLFYIVAKIGYIKLSCVHVFLLLT